MAVGINLVACKPINIVWNFRILLGLKNFALWRSVFKCHQALRIAILVYSFYVNLLMFLWQKLLVIRKVKQMWTFLWLISLRQRAGKGHELFRIGLLSVRTSISKILIHFPRVDLSSWIYHRWAYEVSCFQQKKNPAAETVILSAVQILSGIDWAHCFLLGSLRF
jgi:hypothetical protein